MFSWLENALSNGLGSILSSGINAWSQSKANEANAQNVSDTNTANMKMNQENIAFQKQENKIARQREDNAVQRRANDLAAAGLSKTLAAGSAASANAMQAGQNTMPMQAFQKTAYKANLAGLNYSIAQSKMADEQVESAKLQNEYQAWVNKYVDEHGYPPPSNAVEAYFNKLLGNPDSGYAHSNPTVDGVPSANPLINTGNMVAKQAHEVLGNFVPSLVEDKVVEVQSTGRKLDINTNPLTATKDDIWKLCDAYRDGKISQEEYEKACNRLCSGTTNRASIKKHFREYWNRFK